MAGSGIVVVLMTAGGSATMEARTVTGHGGEVVKRLDGGGSMSVFASAADGVRCAGELVRALPEVRVGVSAGEATQEGGDWFGRPVVEAARLCAAAAGGQVLIAPVALALAGSRLGSVAVEPVGDLELKGLGVVAGVVALRAGAGAAEHRPPAPHLTDDRGDFVGQARELAVLDDAWQAARTGQGRRVVAIRGEAGAGKSRLAAELGRRAHADGAVVLAGRCEPDVLVPYQPVVDALRSWVQGRPAGELRSVLQHDAAELGRLLPEIGAALGAGPATRAEPEAERLRLFTAIERALAAIAARSPLVLVLEDLQWAARPTALLLRHLVRAEAGSPILLVLTWRPEEVDGRPVEEVLGDLLRDPDTSAVVLGGLDRDELAALLRSRDLDAPADALHAESGGNPMFAVELAIQGAAAAGSGPAGSFTALVARRVDRLSARAEAAVRVAAVVGEEFDLDLLARVPDAGPDVEAVADALDEAVAAQVVVEVDGPGTCYRFSHRVVRHAVYGALTRTRRVRIHRRVAAALATLPDPRPGLAAARAHHLVEGAHPDDVDDLVATAIEASRQAEDALAFEDALLHLERAIDALDSVGDPPPALVATLRLAAGRVEWTRSHGKGMRDHVDVAAAASRAARSPVLLARCACLYAEWVTPTGADEQAIALLEEALAALPADEVVARAQVLGFLAWHEAFAGRSHTAGPRSAEALELARATGDRQTMGVAIYSRVTALHGARLAEEVVLADDLHRLASDPLDVTLAMFAHRCRPFYLLAAGNVPAVRAEIDEMRAIGGDDRSSFALALASTIEAQVLLLEGRYDEAEAASNQTLVHAGRDLTFVSFNAAQSYWLAIERGTLPAMLPTLDSIVEIMPSRATVLVMRARARLAAGDLTGARTDFDVIVGDPSTLDALVDDPTVSGTLCDLVELSVALGVPAATAALRERLLGWTGHLVPLLTAYVAGAGDRFVAMADAALGDIDAADARFAAALAVEERAGAVPLAARTRRRWADALDAAGRDPDRAWALRADAAAAAASIGLALP